MNMIEKVARALCAAEGYNPDQLEPGNCVGEWEGVDGTLPNGDPAHWLWRQWGDQARAALEAMRVPTEEMLDAYWHQTGESREMRPRVHTRATRYHEAMIDAALKGEP